MEKVKENIDQKIEHNSLKNDNPKEETPIIQKSNEYAAAIDK